MKNSVIKILVDPKVTKKSLIVLAKEIAHLTTDSKIGDLVKAISISYDDVVDENIEPPNRGSMLIAKCRNCGREFSQSKDYLEEQGWKEPHKLCHRCAPSKTDKEILVKCGTTDEDIPRILKAYEDVKADYLDTGMKKIDGEQIRQRLKEYFFEKVKPNSVSDNRFMTLEHVENLFADEKTVFSWELENNISSVGGIYDLYEFLDELAAWLTQE